LTVIPFTTTTVRRGRVRSFTEYEAAEVKIEFADGRRVSSQAHVTIGGSHRDPNHRRTAVIQFKIQDAERLRGVLLDLFKHL
jgi:hypothetical protein